MNDLQGDLIALREVNIQEDDVRQRGQLPLPKESRYLARVRCLGDQARMGIMTNEQRQGMSGIEIVFNE
jgi:hypothetical protein